LAGIVKQWLRQGLSAACTNMPADWDTWDFWQDYGDKADLVDGIEGNADGDLFNGSYEDLLDYVRVLF